jgi:SAM-dependent MidA family methyltransferase
LQTDLVQFIAETIQRDGPQPFAWFMEQALYHPRLGYYASGRAKIGRRGDFFTNVSVGSVFGRLLAAQFGEVWERLGSVANFSVVEQGAHHGEFAHDVLTAAEKQSPGFFENLRYHIIERFPILRDRQAETLKRFRGKIAWHDSLGSLEPFTGIHFSNELFDSLPVHLIVSTGTGWREKVVDIEAGKFVFRDRAITDAEMIAEMAKRPDRAAGFEMEINLAALHLIDALAKKLVRGYVIAIDYGFARDQLTAPDRVAGTLQIRAQHRRLGSPFDEIGQADISTHVDWTALTERAEKRCLHLTGFTDQHHFLTGLMSRFLGHQIEKTADAKDRRALQTLVHPEMLGRAFQILALGKEVDPAPALAGFRFARDPRAALGI